MTRNQREKVVRDTQIDFGKNETDSNTYFRSELGLFIYLNYQ